MSPWIIALMLSVGASAWIFSKLQQRTGYGNNKAALIGTVTAGIVIFIIVYMTAKLLSPTGTF